MCIRDRTYLVERIVETAARDMGMDPAEIRRKNFITSFPYATPVGLTYDVGNYDAHLTKAMQIADVAGFPARKAASAAKGLKRGLGYSAYIEACGIAPSSVAGALGARAGLFEAGEVRVHPTGSVTVFTGSHSHGQGHETTFAQVCAEYLGAGFDSVRRTMKTNMINMNGWGVVRNDGGFETRWMDRAIIADAAWAAPDKNISHGGAFLFTDSDGKPLSGANKYTITFDMNDLPPVTQFWSIPIYDANGYFVANEINRYTVNSFMLAAGDLVAKDGKLVIYVQHEKPADPDQAKNWLPAPAKGFRFTSRYYGPYAPLVNGTYNMPKVVKFN